MIFFDLSVVTREIRHLCTCDGYGLDDQARKKTVRVVTLSVNKGWTPGFVLSNAWKLCVTDKVTEKSEQGRPQQVRTKFL